jgi:molybdopterin synthase catalytic subunit
VWHEKEPSLVKAMSAKHRSKFAALSPVMDSLKIAQAAINKQTNKQNKDVGWSDHRRVHILGNRNTRGYNGL